MTRKSSRCCLVLACSAPSRNAGTREDFARYTAKVTPSLLEGCTELVDLVIHTRLGLIVVPLLLGLRAFWVCVGVPLRLASPSFALASVGIALPKLAETWHELASRTQSWQTTCNAHVACSCPGPLAADDSCPGCGCFAASGLLHHARLLMQIAAKHRSARKGNARHLCPCCSAWRQADPQRAQRHHCPCANWPC